LSPDQLARYSLTSPHGVEFREGDIIRVTGYSGTCQCRLVAFVGMVATAQTQDGVGAFKLWPEDKDESYGQLTERQKLDGKIWFDLATVELLEVIQKGDLWEVSS
jgi:hypothetical protein